MEQRLLDVSKIHDGIISDAHPPVAVKEERLCDVFVVVVQVLGRHVVFRNFARRHL
jgi:hypothetical protein